MIRSTRQVAELLGLSVHQLSRAVYDGRVSTPKQRHAGAYVWTRADIEVACMALLHRPLETVLAGRQAEGKGADNAG